MNCLGGMGLWDEQDGFYYDVLNANGTTLPLRIRSMVGIIPLFAVEVLEQDVIDRLPGFKKRLEWFIKHRPDLARHITYCLSDANKPSPFGRGQGEAKSHSHRLFAVPSPERLVRVLRYILDEYEFLAPYGVRALSRYHREHPYVMSLGGQEHRVEYVPGESNTGLFGGNSNWRGPIWFPVNYLLIEALERYHHFYGDALRVECPTGSGRLMNLKEVAHELAHALDAAVPPRRIRPPPLPRRRPPLRHGSPLARPRPLPRILPRRHRPRHRRHSPNRLDRARRESAARHRERPIVARTGTGSICAVFVAKCACPLLTNLLAASAIVKSRYCL